MQQSGQPGRNRKIPGKIQSSKIEQEERENLKKIIIKNNC